VGSEGQTGGPQDKPGIKNEGGLKLAIRCVLVILAVWLLWLGFIVNLHATLQLSVTYIFNWRSWLGGNGLYVLGGFSFGLAAILPRRIRFSLRRALVLGAIPLLWLAHLTLLMPASHFTQQHLHFLFTWPAPEQMLNFEATLGVVAAAWLGLAIAAGFEPGGRRAGE
jgi:hypothetical protein